MVCPPTNGLSQFFQRKLKNVYEVLLPESILIQKKILWRINLVLIKCSPNAFLFEKLQDDCENPSFLHKVTCIRSYHASTVAKFHNHGFILKEALVWGVSWQWAERLDCWTSSLQLWIREIGKVPGIFGTQHGKQKCPSLWGSTWEPTLPIRWKKQTKKKSGLLTKKYCRTRIWSCDHLRSRVSVGILNTDSDK